MRFRAITVAVLAGFAVACADVLLSPSEPASIEFVNIAAPSIAVGDSLRDPDGVALQARAIVRNQAGDVLDGAVPVFVYADLRRDTALTVDSVTGYVVALKALKTTTTTARVAARIGTRLQAVRSLLVTLRPDSISQEGSNTLDTLRVALPDTGSAGAEANTSTELKVVVHNIDTVKDSLFFVQNLAVKFDLRYPANPTNDSTAGVFLVNPSRTASNIDTTDAGGSVGRFVRVRSSKFPTGNAVDSAIVRVTVLYRGKPVKGAPIDLKVPIIRKQP